MPVGRGEVPGRAPPAARTDAATYVPVVPVRLAMRVAAPPRPMAPKCGEDTPRSRDEADRPSLTVTRYSPDAPAPRGTPPSRRAVTSPSRPVDAAGKRPTSREERDSARGVRGDLRQSRASGGTARTGSRRASTGSRPLDGRSRPTPGATGVVSSTTSSRTPLTSSSTSSGSGGGRSSCRRSASRRARRSRKESDASDRISAVSSGSGAGTGTSTGTSSPLGARRREPIAATSSTNGPTRMPGAGESCGVVAIGASSVGSDSPRSTVGQGTPCTSPRPGHFT